MKPSILVAYATGCIQAAVVANGIYLCEGYEVSLAWQFAAALLISVAAVPFLNCSIRLSNSDSEY